MENFIADNWGVIATILAFAFNIGFIFKGLKDKSGKSEVYKIASEKIKEHKQGCDYFKITEGVRLQQNVEDLKITVDKIDRRIEKIYGKIMSEK